MTTTTGVWYTFETAETRISDPHGMDIGNQWIEVAHHWSNSIKQDTVKRPRPKGIELLFSTTPLVHTRKTFDDVIFSYEGITTFDHHQVSQGTRASYFGPYSWTLLNQGVDWSDEIGNCVPSVVGIKLRPDGYFVESITLQPTSFPLINTAKLLSAIKAEKINVGMLVAEWHQTQQMYIDAAESLLNTYRGIRKGKLKHLLAKGVRNAPNTWLLYRYGVTPHLADIKAAIDIGTNGLQRMKPSVQRFSVSHKDTRVQEFKVVIRSLPIAMKQIRESNRLIKDTAYVEWDTSFQLENMQRLGLTNPALLAWEVIPFSFVVDWFVNVGETLSGLDALIGAKRVGYYRTTKLSAIARTATGQKFASSESLIRMPSRLTSVQLPTWNPSLNWKRLTDIPALLKGLIKR